MKNCVKCGGEIGFLEGGPVEKIGKEWAWACRSCYGWYQREKLRGDKWHWFYSPALNLKPDDDGFIRITLADSGFHVTVLSKEWEVAGNEIRLFFRFWGKKRFIAFKPGDYLVRVCPVKEEN